MPPTPGPSVAIILVDIDDHPVAPATVESAVSTADCCDGVVVVVDARTTPGRAWLGDNRIQVVGADASIGETALRTRALLLTNAPFVAFLDARAVAGGRWIPASLRVLGDNPDLGAVSAAAAGLGEPTVSFTGNVGAAHPTDTRRRHQVLFPVPEAAVVRRSALVAAGGLREDLTWSCAVLDLGWRLTLLGHPVVLEPEAAVEARCTCRADGYSGLVVLHSCLGPDLLEAVLPAALLVAAARDRIRQDQSGAIDRYIAAAVALTTRREQVQSARQVPDDEVAEMFITALEPARGDDDLLADHAEAIRRHRLPERLPPRRRILVVTPDVLARKMAGPAIRVWQIANALASRHLVQLASTATTCELSSSMFEVSAPDDRGLVELVDRAEIVIIQGFAMEGRQYFRREDKVLLVDLYDPLHLEQLELFKDDSDEHRRVTVRGATRVLNEQLVRGDFFVCASAKQRDFWLGQLAALGRVNHVSYDDDNRLHSLIDVVPFGLPDEPPVSSGPAIKGIVRGIDEEDEVILWGGGIYNWFDPISLIHAVDRLKERRPSVRLFFMGLRHPNPDVAEMRIATEVRRLAKQLRLTDRFVFFNEGWVPYEERQNYLLEASIGVSTHFDHLETEFSFRTRILDYIWARLPIVATDGDWFADLIVKEQLGLVVPALDVDALEEALFRLLTETRLADHCREQLERVRQEFAWSRVLEPVISFCRDARRAPDLLDLDVRRNLWAPDAERQAEWARKQPGIVDQLRSTLRAL